MAKGVRRLDTKAGNTTISLEDVTASSYLQVKAASNPETSNDSVSDSCTSMGSGSAGIPADTDLRGRAPHGKGKRLVR